jgi:hypothetical protein
MADYTDNALLASIKALEQVVMPALDPADPLAGEQLRLVTGMLRFMRKRLPDWHQRQRFELAHYLGLAQALAPDARTASAEVSQRMDAAIAHALALAGAPAPAVADIRSASAALSSAISGLARAVAEAEPGLRGRVEHAILAGSKRWVDMQRAWFLPQGFELRPGLLPELGPHLASIPAGHRHQGETS